MVSPMRGANSHNRMDDCRAARLAVASAFADEHDWLHVEFGEEHVGLKRLGCQPRSPHPLYDNPYMREVNGYDATDTPFVSLVDRYPAYRGRICVCNCGAGMHA